MFLSGPPSGGAPQVRQGRCFQYVVPGGWTVAEDGPAAVVLFAPDRRALTIMAGNAGMPLGYPPPQFTHYWINRQGKVFGTNDPGEDPNVGSTEGWMRMQRSGH